MIGSIRQHVATIKMPFLDEFNQSSRNSFDSDSGSKESQTSSLIHLKSCICVFVFWRFFDSTDSIFVSIQSMLCSRVVEDRVFFQTTKNKTKGVEGPFEEENEFWDVPRTTQQKVQTLEIKNSDYYFLLLIHRELVL